MNDMNPMARALALARAAGQAGEVPVGAVLVDPVSGKTLGEGENAPIARQDPTAHAEILALRAGAAALGNYRLTGLDLYVTLEPCAMCAGAISLARIRRLVFAASDPKGGAVLHGPCLFEQSTCHWRPATVQDTAYEAEAGHLLRDFFRQRRR